MPSGRFFSEFEVGQVFASGERKVTEEEVMQFADLSGDHNPLHVDADFARRTPFGQRVAHGMLAASISTGLGQDTGIFEGTTLALMEQQFQYRAPLFFGESIWLRLTVTAVKPSSKGGKGVVTFASDVLKGEDTTVVTGHWVVLFAARRVAGFRYGDGGTSSFHARQRE